MLTTDKFSIKTLLEKIESGEIQLPDFQRDWVWEDKQIKALLESFARKRDSRLPDKFDSFT